MSLPLSLSLAFFVQCFEYRLVNADRRKGRFSGRPVHVWMSWICLKDFSTAMAPRCSTPLRHVRFPLDLTSVMANDGKKAQSLKPFAIPFPAQIFKLHGDSQADLPSIRMNWMWQK